MSAKRGETSRAIVSNAPGKPSIIQSRAISTKQSSRRNNVHRGLRTPALRAVTGATIFVVLKWAVTGPILMSV
jgi:hypothetical protein